MATDKDTDKGTDPEAITSDIAPPGYNSRLVHRGIGGGVVEGNWRRGGGLALVHR